MTKQILVYADSLSWGIIPMTRKRFAFDERWPGIVELTLNKMGKKVRVTIVAAGFENIGEADEIGLRIDMRIGDRIAHARLRGQVDDDIGLAGGHGRLQGGVVFKQGFGGGKARMR